MTRVYYKDSVGGLVVFDLTRRSTLESALKWKKDIDSKVFLPNSSHIIPGTKLFKNSKHFIRL